MRRLTRNSIDEAELSKRGFWKMGEKHQSIYQSSFDCFRLIGVPVFVRGRYKDAGTRCTLVFDPLTGHIWRAEDHIDLYGAPFYYADFTICGLPVDFKNLRLQPRRILPL